MIGSMFMRVNSKCAHQLRPPPAGPVAPDLGGLPESNCGGRLTESGRATIEALPEVVAEVGGSYSGVRRRQRGAAPTCSRRWRSAQKRRYRPSVSVGTRCIPLRCCRIEILQDELKLAMSNCGARASPTSRERM